MSEYDQLMQLIRSRRSVRRFSARAVGRDVILHLLEAARWGPSNHNRQPWRFIVLEDSREIVKLAERVGAQLSEELKSLPCAVAGYAEDFASYATFFAQAPLLLVVLHKRPIRLSDSLLQGSAHPELVSGEPLSVAMSVQNLLLAAQALGLGSCVLTAPLIVPAAVSEVVKLPAGHDLTCLVAIGYPDEQPPPPRRKSIEQIAEFRNDSGRPESA